MYVFSRALPSVQLELKAPRGPRCVSDLKGTRASKGSSPVAPYQDASPLQREHTHVHHRGAYRSRHSQPVHGRALRVTWFHC